ncbi:Twin-arginine translocation pathway signal [Bordetella sp. H567]|uniref:Bug family tripartite tricarboxylate transporter substrate binding protein n=1 Tax=Bordetella sp. H567 TaxID=1697043 RepID=UPI00081C52B7|nr:tripartite tricarboxylate transporter substrate binding protein [Bordetella sp. H567]AOB31257.1 Twin-arginine translocation pathway signal [Bordetella sp. H567]
MDIVRRRLNAAALGLASIAVAPRIAYADDKWPSKPIRIIVPFAAGGANDLLGRAAAEGIAQYLKASVIVENKPGAGAVIGTDYVARADNDGYTFLISGAGVISNSMIRKVQYKDSDLVPVAMIGLAPSVIIAPASSPYKDLKDFVEASKKSRGGLHFSTAGTGSTPHFVEGILTTDYGAKLDLVPYKSGSESVSAVIGGQVDATSEASIVVLPMVRAGKLKALACTWSERIKAYPELSTAAEQGFPKIKIAHWAGVHAPKGTPDDILDKIAAGVDHAMKDPANVKRLTELGIEPVGGTRAEFVKFCDEERARLGAVVKATGMRQDS